MQHTILVIDDQWSMQEMVRLVLQQAGYRVILADDGITGLTLAHTEHPDAIILDLRMPEMDGVEVLRSLNLERRTAGIPVILISAGHFGERLHEGLCAGAATFLQKPFPSCDLIQRVEGVLQTKEMPIAV